MARCASSFRWSVDGFHAVGAVVAAAAEMHTHNRDASAPSGLEAPLSERIFDRAPPRDARRASLATAPIASRCDP